MMCLFLALLFMAIPLKKRKPERRLHQRVNVNLNGRYMLANQKEYTCQTLNMSPGGVALIAPQVGETGERVIVYLDQIGRLDGLISRLIDKGFAMSFQASGHKRDKLAAQLTWLANRHSLGLPEDRAHERIVPKNTRGRLTLNDGREFFCTIIDVSVTGAAVKIDLQPIIGTPVTLGKTKATVVRVFEGGIALQFAQPQAPNFNEFTFD
jgi:c-di-GMP-binding flagellar brake protein YcgR